MPGCLLSRYSPIPGVSVPFCCVMRYCSGESLEMASGSLLNFLISFSSSRTCTAASLLHFSWVGASPRLRLWNVFFDQHSCPRRNQPCASLSLFTSASRQPFWNQPLTCRPLSTARRHRQRAQRAASPALLRSHSH